MVALWIFLFVLAALTAVSITLAWKVSGMIVQPKNWEYDSVFDEEEKRGHFTREWYQNECHPEEFALRSPYGYDLHCALWPHKEGVTFPDGRARVAVLCHGITYCLLGAVKYAKIFHELGFDCVFYDHRNHGLSGRAPTTMGVCEARDLSAVCDWALDRFGRNAVLGTHGESMGAATVMLHAPQYPALSFAIEDCGYSSLAKQISHNIHDMYHLPVFPIVPLASLISRLRGGMLFCQVVPMDAAARCEKLPMLFIHGENDTFVPYEMVHEIYGAKPGFRRIKTFPGAEHAKSYSSDPAGYRACMESFLLEIGAI